MNERHKILKPEINTDSQVMLKKHSNEKDSAAESSIVKWKWSPQQCAAGGGRGSAHRQTRRQPVGAPALMLWPQWMSVLNFQSEIFFQEFT